MTFEMGALIALVATIVAAAAGYGRNANKIEAQKEINENLWKVVHEIERWRQEHLTDAAEKRVELERELGRVRENAGRGDIKLDAILSRLDKIDEKIDKLETRDERRT